MAGASWDDRRDAAGEIATESVSVAALSLLSWVHNAPTASDRKLWSDSKIVLLLEPRSSVDLDKLLGSEVDAASHCPYLPSR